MKMRNNVELSARNNTEESTKSCFLESEKLK